MGIISDSLTDEEVAAQINQRFVVFFSSAF